MTGADGSLYTGWADGHQGPLVVECRGPDAKTGWAVFNGTSPRDLRLVDHGTVAAPGGVGGELAGMCTCKGADTRLSLRGCERARASPRVSSLGYTRAALATAARLVVTHAPWPQHGMLMRRPHDAVPCCCCCCRCNHTPPGPR